MAQRSMPDPHDFPSNNGTQAKVNAAQDALDKERPKVQAVVTGVAIKKKRSFGQRVAEVFTGDDARSVGNYVVMDVLVPSAKNMISDAFTTFVERMLFGDGRGGGRPRSGGSSYGPYTPYNRSSASPSRSSGAPPWRTDDRREMSSRGRAMHDFREVIIDNRVEAGQVLDTLTEMVQMYEVATVADYYEASNITPEFTDRQWGWTNLGEARIDRVREGYLISMPPPVPLK